MPSGPPSLAAGVGFEHPGAPRSPTKRPRPAPPAPAITAGCCGRRAPRHRPGQVARADHPPRGSPEDLSRPGSHAGPAHSRDFKVISREQPRPPGRNSAWQYRFTGIDLFNGGSVICPWVWGRPPVGIPRDRLPSGVLSEYPPSRFPSLWLVACVKDDGGCIPAGASASCVYYPPGEAAGRRLTESNSPGPGHQPQRY